MPSTDAGNLVAALVQLRYPDLNPFVSIPKTMLFLVVSSLLHYLLQIVVVRFPNSRFSAMAKHLTFLFACAAVASLFAALYPDPRSITSIFTIFVLLELGHVLFLLGVFAVEDEADHVDENGVQADRTWFESFTTHCRRYKNKLARGVAGFFQEQTTAEVPL